MNINPENIHHPTVGHEFGIGHTPDTMTINTPTGKKVFKSANHRKTSLSAALTELKTGSGNLGQVLTHWKDISHRTRGLGVKSRFMLPVEYRGKSLTKLDKLVDAFNHKEWANDADLLQDLIALRNEAERHLSSSGKRKLATQTLIDKCNDAISAQQAKGIDIPQQDAQPTSLNDFPADFKAVVAQKKLLSEVSATELSAIGQHMNTYFESEGLAELRQSIHLSDENLASAWMMKLSFNRHLSDQQFLTYMKRGEAIFNGDTVPDLNFSSAKKNDLPAMAWYLKGVSGQQLFEKGATRVHLTNNKTWSLFQKMQAQMKPRISTHFGGTKLTEKGYGKDIPNESLRDHMPFQFGALLMYPTSKNANEDLFALRLSTMNENEITTESVSTLYTHAFEDDIPAPMLTAIIQNKANLTSKLAVFEQAHQLDPSRFNIDVGIKLEDFGHGDRSYHTAVHSKYGKPLAFLKKKIWNIGSKKTKLKSTLAKNVSGKKVKMTARKEHMSTLPKAAQELALRMADLMPDFQRGTKTRIDFSFKSLRRGMQEDTIQLKTSGSKSKGKTTAISYLMERAKLSNDPQVQSLLRRLEDIVAPLQASDRIGSEGREEQLSIGEFFSDYANDMDASNATGAQEHHQTNVSDAKRLARKLNISTAAGTTPLSDSTDASPSSDAYFMDCYKALMTACQPHDATGNDHLTPLLNNAENVQSFFNSIAPNDNSLFVQVMKAFNQRSTAFSYERLSSKYNQTGYTLTDKNNDYEANKEYYVSFENGQATVTQKIEYFIRPLSAPDQVAGSFEMTFSTTIDSTTKQVTSTSVNLTPTSPDVPLQSTFGKLMTELSHNS